MRGYDIQGEGARLLWEVWQAYSKMEKSVAKKGACWLWWRGERIFVQVVGWVARLFGGVDRGFVGSGGVGRCAGACKVIESSFGGGGVECDTSCDSECGAVAGGGTIG